MVMEFPNKENFITSQSKPWDKGVPETTVSENIYASSSRSCRKNVITIFKHPGLNLGPYC